MPLTLAKIGEENIIKKIGGSPGVKRHLENLGFTAGGSVRVIAALGGSILVSVRDVRVALGRELGCKIII